MHRKKNPRIHSLRVLVYVCACVYVEYDGGSYMLGYMCLYVLERELIWTDRKVKMEKAKWLKYILR